MYVRPIPRIRRPVVIRASSNVRHVVLYGTLFTITKLNFRYVHILCRTYKTGINTKYAPFRREKEHTSIPGIIAGVLAGRKALAL